MQCGPAAQNIKGLTVFFFLLSFFSLHVFLPLLISLCLLCSVIEGFPLGIDVDYAHEVNMKVSSYARNAVKNTI